MPYSIQREDAAKDAAAVRQAIRQSPLTVEAYEALSELADSIEEQVKPEEPLGFGTIVQVANGMMVVRIGAAMRTPWRSGYDAWNWEDLDNPKLYRVGLTPADDPLSDDGAALPVRRDGGESPAAAPSSQRFCTLSFGCRLADGHTPGCKP